MALKKTPKRKPIRAPSSTATGRMNLLLENMQTHLNMVIDAVHDSRRIAARDTAELREDMGQRSTILEIAVRMNSESIEKNTKALDKNSEDIRKNSEDIRKNSEDIKKNSEDIRDMRIQLENLNSILRVNDRENVIHTLQKRVGALEERVGISH